MADEPNRGGNDELAGMVFMSGDEVAWAGPMAVFGHVEDEQQEDEQIAEEGEVLGVADGSDYNPPPEETPE